MPSHHKKDDIMGALPVPDRNHYDKRRGMPSFYCWQKNHRCPDFGTETPIPHAVLMLSSVENDE